MQAVILAAGRGSRMGHLTDTTPKPMLKVSGKPLLEYKLDALPAEVDEVVFIIGHLGDQVRAHFGDTFKGKKVSYVVQENPVGGTADALWQAKDKLQGRFFVMNGDNLYGKTDMERCLSYQWAIVVRHTAHMGRAAEVITDPNGRIQAILESGSEVTRPGLINTGLYLLDTRIFEYPQKAKAVGSSETGLPQTMLQAVGKIDIQAVPATLWVEIKRPEDIAKAEEELKGIQI